MNRSCRIRIKLLSDRVFECVNARKRVISNRQVVPERNGMRIEGEVEL